MARTRIALSRGFLGFWGVLATSACTSAPPADPVPGASGGGGPASGGSTSSGGAIGPASGGSVATGGQGAGGVVGSGGAVAGGGAGGAVVSGPKIGAPDFGPGELDEPSHGATITFRDIGAPGWYPSRRDPASGMCDAVNNGSCCMTPHNLTDDKLSPWNEDLIMTLRGPVVVKQLVVYQPDAANTASWSVTSVWDSRSPGSPEGMAFDGDGSFEGTVGSECLTDAMTATSYPCGPMSVPYCPAGDPKYYGWAGSKLFILLADMPHVGGGRIDDGVHCGTGNGGGWWDAPWIGLSHGELVRSGKFGDCHCYAKNPAEWYLADGCGQFNVFEVVNDNNEYRNLDLFSTNFFAYHGYVGEGPCGQNCNVSGLSPTVDLVDKSNSQEAAMGAVASPSMGPGAAFRRPATGYRYFLMLLDVDTRTVQLGMMHPQAIPASITSLLPELPRQIPRALIDSVLALRLPN